MIISNNRIWKTIISKWLLCTLRGLIYRERGQNEINKKSPNQCNILTKVVIHIHQLFSLARNYIFRFYSHTKKIMATRTEFLSKLSYRKLSIYQFKNHRVSLGHRRSTFFLMKRYMKIFERRILKKHLNVTRWMSLCRFYSWKFPPKNKSSSPSHVQGHELRQILRMWLGVL